jgi:hypothetical protein
MARKTAARPDPDMDYAENTTGMFRSGWTPSARPSAVVGGDNVASTDEQGNTVNYRRSGFPGPPQQKAAAVASRQSPGGLYPATQDKLVGRGMIPDVTDSRGNSFTSRQSVAQMLAQDNFDKRMGFAPAKRSKEDMDAIAAAVNPAKPASMTPGANSTAVPTPGAPASQAASGLEFFGNPVKLGANVSSDTSNALLSVPGSDGAPPPVNPAYSDPTGIVGAAPKLASAVVGAAKAVGRGALKAGSFVNPEAPIAQPGGDTTGIASAVPAVKSAASAAGQFINAGGSDVPAGVSNATAAQFQTPTKANPLPVTPTSPTPNIDKSDSSLSRFGYSEDELNRRKTAFAGF